MKTETACHKTPSNIIGGPKSKASENEENPYVLAEEKVLSISRQLRNLRGNSVEELVVVDTIQRLGMDHLFQQEIDEVLHTHYSKGGLNVCSDDLRGVSLRFRLLRQAGYDVPAQTFEGFIGQDGKFKEELGEDTKGLVSLFEASQMSTHEEWILDEVGAFCKRNLGRSSNQTVLVQDVLNYPIQKTLTRFTAHDFLSTLSTAKGWRNELQQLAKKDFNAAQKTYLGEIGHISQ